MYRTKEMCKGVTELNTKKINMYFTTSDNHEGNYKTFF